MKALRPSNHWPIVAMFVIFAGVLAYQSHANRPQPRLTAAVVGTVNLEIIFEKLNERDAADASLLKVAGELDSEGLRRREKLQELQEEMELFAPGSPQFDKSSQELAKETYQLQAFLDFANRKLDVYKARALRRLYMSIRDSVRELSETHGYDVVFVDDSVVAMPSEGTEAEMMRQISARRTIFANERIDITDQVIDLMNERFAAGG